MKKEEMVCSNCVSFEDPCCCLRPRWVVIGSPDTHFCSRGEWQKWDSGFPKPCRFYWGDWEDETPIESGGAPCSFNGAEYLIMPKNIRLLEFWLDALSRREAGE
jgi:hypothetical protein